MKKGDGKHMRSRRGTLLVEIVVAMTVSVFFLGSLFQGLRGLQGCVSRWDRSVRMRQGLTAALFHVVGDIRMAGCDPWESGRFAAVDVSGRGGPAGARVSVWFDKRGRDPDTWPDGDAEDPDEHVEYHWDAVEDLLRRNGQPVLPSLDGDPWSAPFLAWEESHGAGLARVTLRVKEQDEERTLSACACVRNPL